VLLPRDSAHGAEARLLVASIPLNFRQALRSAAVAQCCRGAVLPPRNAFRGLVSKGGRICGRDTVGALLCERVRARRLVGVLPP